MLDIAIGIFVAWRNGNKAAEKGHSKGQWVALTLGLWFGGEVLGIIIGIALIGKDVYGRVQVLPAFGVGLVFMIMGGVVSWLLVDRLAAPAWQAAMSSFIPTHSAPAGGLPATDAPDPTRPVTGTIPEFQPLMVIGQAGDWAQAEHSTAGSAGLTAGSWFRETRQLVGSPGARHRAFGRA